MDSIASPAALQGVRVIEMGQLIAGPFCGKTLGEFGADVIKIEAPADPSRPGASGGDVLAKTGAVRDGGSYESRMGGIACWNALMDENNYMVQKWNEFVAA